MEHDPDTVDTVDTVSLISSHLRHLASVSILAVGGVLVMLEIGLLAMSLDLLIAGAGFRLLFMQPAGSGRPKSPLGLCRHRGIPIPSHPGIKALSP
jgi:hypothetical protein